MNVAGAFIHLSMVRHSGNVSKSGLCPQMLRHTTAAASNVHPSSLSTDPGSTVPVQVSAATSVTMTLRTCRQCKKKFDPVKNHGAACSYHSESYTGDSRRKGHWGDSAGTSSYVSGDGAAEYFWWYVIVLNDSQH